MVEDSSHTDVCPVSSEASPPASRELVEALREWADVTAETDTEAQRQEDRLLEAWRAFQGSDTALANTPGWRDIETAPRDGTIFHVWADGYEYPETVVWREYDPEVADELDADGYWDFAEELLSSAVDGVGEEDWTHWRPLPQPPEVK